MRISTWRFDTYDSNGTQEHHFKRRGNTFKEVLAVRQNYINAGYRVSSIEKSAQFDYSDGRQAYRTA